MFYTSNQPVDKLVLTDKATRRYLTPDTFSENDQSLREQLDDLAQGRLGRNILVHLPALGLFHKAGLATTLESVTGVPYAFK